MTDIFTRIENAICENRSTDWIMNNVVGCGWDQDDFYDFCVDLSVEAEKKHNNIKDRYMELADKCWDAFDETDWDEDDPSFEVE